MRRACLPWKKINKTLQAAKVSRRSVLKGAAATGAAAAIGPYYVPNAFAAPVVNVLMWGEYLPDSVVADFKAKTGITVAQANAITANTAKQTNVSTNLSVSPGNNDFIINIQDILIMIGFILNVDELNHLDLWLSDFDSNQIINVQDIILIIDIALLFFGLYQRNTNIELGDKFVGSSVLIFCFVLLPVFLYYRYSKRDLEDYIYKD